MKQVESIVAVLDNVRSLYNVGSIFRTSDALGVQKLYLCGITGTPENPRLAKTALAALNAVRWEHKISALQTVKQLKKQGYYIVALERIAGSKPVTKVRERPLAIIVGHERNGTDTEILALADQIVEVPMYGIGVSMNVAVAYGIASYVLTSPIAAE
jgi:23S rRNA (guanosine2251-2'-O)-methyltransferase